MASPYDTLFNIFENLTTKFTGFDYFFLYVVYSTWSGVSLPYEYLNTAESIHTWQNEGSFVSLKIYYEIQSRCLGTGGTLSYVFSS